jgi:hypothetical protein
MIPLRSLMTANVVVGPQLITRYNNLRAVNFNGATAPGHSSGEALAAMERASQKVLSPGYTFEWTGTALQQRRRPDSAVWQDWLVELRGFEPMAIAGARRSRAIFRQPMRGPRLLRHWFMGDDRPAGRGRSRPGDQLEVGGSSVSGGYLRREPRYAHPRVSA